MRKKRLRRAVLAAAVGVSGAEAAMLVRRRGYVLGASTVVRCRDGHLFTTIWIPGASLKALRLGWWRVQHCPVGAHWTLVTPARLADLNAEELQLASERHNRWRVAA